MEIRMQDSYGSTSVLDGYIDTNAPISLLEQEAVKLMEEARALTEDNAIKEAQADVVVQLVERLYTVQEQAFADFEEDMRDGTINHANNASIFDVVNQRRNRGLNLFWMKEENPKKFMETIKQLSDKDIFMVALNMNEGISAFNACYEELLSRIGSGNIFDHIDSIVASREGKNDNIREALLTSAMTTSLMRNKMNDLDKRLGSYIKKEEILSILQQGILENEGLKK
ncbi:MAG: hypothetical protein LBO09_05645 [Candidatus Peribacteria bacterium]|jgi:hypothetical protein|nr:hypothetical protein [Candidatus Peribacteria bacterium]